MQTTPTVHEVSCEERRAHLAKSSSSSARPSGASRCSSAMMRSSRRSLLVRALPAPRPLRLLPRLCSLPRNSTSAAPGRPRPLPPLRSALELSVLPSLAPELLRPDASLIGSDARLLPLRKSLEGCVPAPEATSSAASSWHSCRRYSSARLPGGMAGSSCRISGGSAAAGGCSCSADARALPLLLCTSSDEEVAAAGEHGGDKGGTMMGRRFLRPIMLARSCRPMGASVDGARAGPASCSAGPSGPLDVPTTPCDSPSAARAARPASTVRISSMPTLSTAARAGCGCAAGAAAADAGPGSGGGQWSAPRSRTAASNGDSSKLADCRAGLGCHTLMLPAVPSSTADVSIPPDPLAAEVRRPELARSQECIRACMLTSLATGRVPPWLLIST